MPTSAEGELPQTKIGAILAIADKLDSILAFFAVDMIPSGSNDPYALRRQAFGIVRIIADQDWHLPLMNIQPLLAKALAGDEVTVNFDLTKNSDQVRDFFLDRLKQLFHGQNLRHDIIDAVTDTEQADIANVIEAAATLNAHKDDKEFKSEIEALNRVLRIAKKADQVTVKVDPTLFENQSESKLFQAVNTLESQADSQSTEELFAALRQLAPLINEYFDENMIMDKNEQIKNNRLAQLNLIAQRTKLIGNLDNLIVK